MSIIKSPRLIVFRISEGSYHHIYAVRCNLAEQNESSQKFYRKSMPLCMAFGCDQIRCFGMLFRDRSQVGPNGPAPMDRPVLSHAPGLKPFSCQNERGICQPGRWRSPEEGTVGHAGISGRRRRAGRKQKRIAAGVRKYRHDVGARRRRTADGDGFGDVVEAERSAT